MVISIALVICTYNNASLLSRTLKAISQQQSYDPSTVWQVLVVDNNCTDDTVAVATHYQSLIPQLNIIQEPIQGLTPARLCGVRNTTADWIAFVDDDCLLAPNWVAAAGKFAAAHPDCSAFGGQVILDWETPPPLFVHQFHYSFAEQAHGNVARPVECLVGAGMVINRQVLQSTGWIDRPLLADRIGKRLVSGGDVELALRLGAKRPLWYTPDCQLQHVIPAYRISPRYLMRINAGLGVSKVYGDAMLWSGTYSALLRHSLEEGVRQIKAIAIDAVKALAGRRSKIAVAINAHFWWGWWKGLWQLWRMESYQRQAIIGSALPSPKKKILHEVLP